MKTNEAAPKWIENLRFLMKHRQFNPRSLSLAAGLNATAVRDMLEGRAKSPRYDTVEALSRALNVTPAQLMGGTPDQFNEDGQINTSKDPLADDDLNLLTEIITRLQEAAQAYQHKLQPQDFAAMVTSIYRKVSAAPNTSRTMKSEITPHIDSLMSYEALRQKSSSKK